jgi:hypothetical protein
LHRILPLSNFLPNAIVKHTSLSEIPNLAILAFKKVIATSTSMGNYAGKGAVAIEDDTIRAWATTAVFLSTS